MTVNHTMMASMRKLPACDECGAPALHACISANKTTREPHAIRLAVASGTAFVIRTSQIKTVQAMRALKSLIKACDEAKRFDAVALENGYVGEATQKRRGKKRAS